MRKAWPALAVGMIVSVPRLAGAEVASLPLELAWDAPAGCPDAPRIRQRVEQILGGPVSAPTRVTAHAKVDTSAEGRFLLAMTVRTGDVEETRRIEAASCTAVAEAFAVIVALAIVPTRQRSAIDESTSVAAERDEPSVARELSPVAPLELVPPPPGVEPLPPARGASASGGDAEGIHLAFGLGGLAGVGTLPHVNAGGVASAVVRLHRFRVGVLGSVSLRQEPYFDRTAGASFDMIEAGVFGGYMVPLGIVALGPCVNLEMAHVQVRGFGIRQPRTSTSIWPMAVLGGRIEVRVARWIGLFARGDLAVPLGAPTFTLATSSDAVQLHEPARVAPRLSLGAEIVLP